MKAIFRLIGAGFGATFLGVLQAITIVAKTVGLISWSWWLVFSPLALMALILLVIATIFLLFPKRVYSRMIDDMFENIEEIEKELRNDER